MAIMNLDQRASKPTEETIMYSSFQTDIFRAIKETQDNIIVEAVAGSGKTTTVVHGLEMLPTGESTIFVAFNKSVATELSKKVPPFVEARTLHAVGMGILRSNYKYVKVNGKKVSNILRFELLDTKSNAQHNEWCWEHSQDVCKLISRLKSNLVIEADHGIIDNYIDDLDLDLPTDHWSMTVYIELLRLSWVFTGEKGGAVIDFDDMLALPVLRGDELNWPTYDNVIIDEVQDLNMVQRHFISLLAGESGRVIAVGDTKQAIYGFRGADHNSMSLMKQQFNCTEYPLSICYRCDTSIVDKAQRFVPHIEARTGASSGLVTDLNYGEHFSYYKAGDHILCRLNAPLVKEALRLSIQGNNVCILGKDLVSGLMKIAKSICHDHDLVTARHLNYYYEEQAEQIPDSKAYKRYALQDKCQVLSYIVGSTPMDATAIKKVLDMIFSDKPPVTAHIALSTIHKAKGLEADRVFILRPDYLPHPLAKSPEELQQEYNLEYVAITRAKHELYYVWEDSK